MADQTASTASNAEERALDALTKIIESAVAPDMLDAQQIILRRLALAGDLFPGRVPAPRNITEIGGYLNILADQPEMRLQMLAATLGIAGPNLMPGWAPDRPTVSFTLRANDRPAGAAQATIPVNFTVRTDFAVVLEDALAKIRAKGGTFPMLSPPRMLPTAAIGSAGTAVDELLAVVGRVIEAMPGTALVDPLTDPLAVGASGTGVNEVLARQLDSAAADAASVADAAWNLWACTASSCAQQAVTGKYFPVTAFLNAAGWHQAQPLAAPTSAAAPGGWARWTNVTGLVAGRTRLLDELTLLYTSAEISRSRLADKLDWIWNGTTFATPA